jgi:biopolymer transport protein ExbB
VIQAFIKWQLQADKLKLEPYPGIYTAMTTTVVGLVVGIIAYVGYNHLVVKTDKIVHQMEANAVDF